MGADDNSLLRYSESCTSVAAEYIERSTRFNVKDVRVLDARSAMRQVLITIRHELEVTSAIQEHHGLHQPDHGDLGSDSWARYQEQVAAQAESEFTRAETMDSLVNAVTSQAYAVISGKTCIRTHPSRLFHTYACGECNGAGNVACRDCSGSGEVPCSDCDASGNVNCPNCHGSKTVTQVRRVFSAEGRESIVKIDCECTSCVFGQVKCYSCGGSGCERCATCRGSGHLSCAACSSHGCLTRITTTHTYTNPSFSGRYLQGTPDYVHSALSKVGFAHLENYASIALQNTHVTRDTASVEFLYECSMPFCELSIDVMGLKSNWILFGAAPQIFDAGGALEALLKSDFEHLSTVAGSRSRWRPWFHRPATHAVAPFMESELNQQLIEASSAGVAAKEIAECVNWSVSESYIQESLLNLKRTVRVAANWSRLKWLLALTLLSLPFAIAAVAYLKHEKRLEFLPGAQLPIYPPHSSGFMLEMALMTVPFTALGWFLARWISTRWLKKAGDKRIVVWAEQNGLLMGKWTAITIIVMAAGTAGAFFNRWPLWIDPAGKAYGQFALFQPPQIIHTVQPTMKVVEKKRGLNKKAAQQKADNTTR
ncbi:hypothetical protein [Janthinobacterium fluminis]|uniref:Uncharacterized protein n=1 Tax=Janthinobacterium fluminis TaxID=2987524 RepID=A0ABT5JXX5_9BURK|nr:hypothetical protein [Janthinobacterium fluminis]MDC8756896.1 hypothetical protein [Janthinobacterium fluminis]